MNQQNKAYYPWQQTQWEHLLKAKTKTQVPHAILLLGGKGLGKLKFAQSFAKTMLCTHATVQSYCDQCRHCHLFDVATHPDYTFLSAASDSPTIKIDEIRRLIETANQTPQQAQHKVIVIEPAEAMNIAAANALLKVLEEPPGHTVFLLVCHQLNQLPATIRSRCQIVKFSAPALQDSHLWLEGKGVKQATREFYLSLANASPLLALEYSEAALIEHRDTLLMDLTGLVKHTNSFVAIVEKWIKQDMSVILNILLSLIIDIIRLKSRLNLRYITHQDKAELLQEFACFLNLPILYKLLDKLYKMQQLIRNRANINHQLLLEDFAASMLDLSLVKDKHG